MNLLKIISKSDAKNLRKTNTIVVGEHRIKVGKLP